MIGFIVIEVPCLFVNTEAWLLFPLPSSLHFFFHSLKIDPPPRPLPLAHFHHVSFHHIVLHWHFRHFILPNMPLHKEYACVFDGCYYDGSRSSRTQHFHMSIHSTCDLPIRSMSNTFDALLITYIVVAIARCSFTGCCCCYYWY